MTRKIIDISRRQMLVGLGGVTLGLPVLSSLLTKTAFGQDPTFVRRPRLFWMTTDHGGAFDTSMFPDPAMLTRKESLFADHEIAAGALTSTVTGSVRSVSPILSADSSRFTEQLLSKMNVLRGIDVPFYIAHNTGMHLGNYARNDGNGADGKAVQPFKRPTIDQIMAWSPSFYDNLAPIKERVMQIGDQAVSWNYSDPEAKTGDIQSIRGDWSSKQLFNRIFVESQPTTEPAMRRQPIVDRVLDSYKKLRNGNSRLSSYDRQRLDDHIARIAELERKLTAIAPPSASCSSITPPTDDSRSHVAGLDFENASALARLVNDVMVAGFMCGTSRIGLFAYGSTNPLVSFTGDWHEGVAHKWQNEASQAVLVPSYQKTFEHMLLDLAAKLDVEEAPGMTYLDNSLLVWTQESGQSSHDAISIPIVTFGSAAGYFNTGQYLDYRRNGNKDSLVTLRGEVPQMYLGVLYNQWLATVLQSMGIPASEYELWDHKGYGYPYVGTDQNQAYFKKHYGDTSSRYFEMAGDVLPFLKA